MFKVRFYETTPFEVKVAFKEDMEVLYISLDETKFYEKILPDELFTLPDDLKEIKDAINDLLDTIDTSLFKNPLDHNVYKLDTNLFKGGVVISRETIKIEFTYKDTNNLNKQGKIQFESSYDELKNKLEQLINLPSKFLP